MKSFKEFIIVEKFTKNREALIDFFTNNPYPKDEKIHELAKQLNMEPDAFETEIYAILTDFFAKGKYNALKEKPKFDQEELDKGIKIEMEHTSCQLIAERIAKDHMVENKNYYSKYLIPMEKQMDKDKGEK
jgi:hypothetical protein